MLRKSNYLYSAILFIFGVVYCFMLSYPTKEHVKQYQIAAKLKEKSLPHTNKTRYTKIGVVKDVLCKSDLFTRRYRISCPNSLVSIHQTKNIFRISEELEDAQILLQEKEGAKNSSRLFQAKHAFCNYHLNTLSSPELYFFLFDSFYPIPTQKYWQGVANGASLLVKKKHSPVLQAEFITFLTPEHYE